MLLLIVLKLIKKRPNEAIFANHIPFKQLWYDEKEEEEDPFLGSQTHY